MYIINIYLTYNTHLTGAPNELMFLYTVKIVSKFTPTTIKR